MATLYSFEGRKSRRVGVGCEPVLSVRVIRRSATADRTGGTREPRGLLDRTRPGSVVSIGVSIKDGGVGSGVARKLADRAVCLGIVAICRDPITLVGRLISVRSEVDVPITPPPHIRPLTRQLLPGPSDENTNLAWT